MGSENETVCLQKYTYESSKFTNLVVFVGLREKSEDHIYSLIYVQAEPCVL